MDLLSGLAKVAHNEVATWAGLVNLAGLFALIKLGPAEKLADRAFDTVIHLVEGSRKYRAERVGRSYEPLPQSRRHLPDKPLSPVATMVVLLVYVVICVAIIAAAKRFS